MRRSASCELLTTCLSGSVPLRAVAEARAALARTWLADVPCRILVEEASEADELVERSFNYFAQSDDGTVYYFGEVVNNYVDGVIDNHDGSWLVGGPNQSGDVFKPEDLFPIVDETAEIVGVDLDVLVHGVKYDGAIKVEESTLLAPGTEFKWYAPGVGVVKVQAKGETLRLSFSALVQIVD